MLQSLSIRNFALIESADLTFPDGFIAITGETGSGKSILLGALNLMLGERADYSVIRNPEEKTVVEAAFRLSDTYKDWFEEQELDFDSMTIIRREITNGGKSRAFINDTPVQLTTLKELTEQLVYIHSQHQTLALKQMSFQFSVLDAVGETDDLALKVKDTVRDLRKKENELNTLHNASAAAQREIDFARFQYEELIDHDLEKVSYEDLDKQLRSLSNVDQLKELFQAISEGITEDNGPVDRLRILKALSDKQKSTHADGEQLHERITAALIELNDIAGDAQTLLDKLDSDPERIAELTEKVDRYNRLLNKHHVQNQEELLTIQHNLEEQLRLEDSKDERIQLLEQEIASLFTEAKKLSDNLFERRSKTAELVAKRIVEHLAELKMEDTRMVFSLERLPELDANGGMTVSCQFSANKALDLKPIDKAASGGELSRLMLAIQAELSSKKGLPTLILDEIDTGVSGDVALRVGRFLARLGNAMQLFAVTHLPQVAAKSAHHFEVKKDQSRTQIVPLKEEERIHAIAKIMSGEIVTEAALDNARQLVLQ